MFNNRVWATKLHLLAPDTGAGDGGGQPNGEPAAGEHGDGNSANNGTEPGSTIEGKQAQNEPAKKYTDKDVDDIINRKFAEWQKKQDEKATEAQKLAGMSERERLEAEKKAEAERANSLQAKLDAYNMRDTARKLFASAKVNVAESDLDLVVTADADSTKAKVNQFIDFAKRIRKAAEHDYLNGDVSKANSQSVGTKGTRGEQIAKAALSSAQVKNPYFQNN